MVERISQARAYQKRLHGSLMTKGTSSTKAQQYTFPRFGMFKFPLGVLFRLRYS
jgi:hypothetical protein